MSNTTAPRFAIIETTEGAESFAVIHAGVALCYGFRFTTEQTFASKAEAQEWLWSEIEAWQSVGGGL